jgi:hypothetical protein
VLKNHTGSDGEKLASAISQSSAAQKHENPMISLNRRERVDPVTS